VGFTLCEIDKVLNKYAEKSYDKYRTEYIDILSNINALASEKSADEYALKKVENDFKQGFQEWEYKLNTVGSSRGDYPFVTMTFGLGTNLFEKMASRIFLEVHKNGQGADGFKIPVLFPKLVFLYDEELHGNGCVNEDLFLEAIDCSSKTMYPDYLSLTGNGYVAEMYKKYKTVVSPMGCRAFLSPWYENGGLEPLSNDDKAIFVGRFNMGAVSMNLPMIYKKSVVENKNFYDVLDYYMEIIRKLSLRTIDYIGSFKASTNPVAYCQGGFLGGNLKPNDCIRPLLKAMTVSFGITALNELQELYNSKSLVEDGNFAIDVMKHINENITRYKKEDEVLYAIYGTPAESLCGLQVEQFRNKFGVIENVSDRGYVSNSFHCHVTEDISPIKKQDLEYRFWDLFNGGKIQYVKYNLGYNKEAIKTLVRRAMEMGFYEGVNLALSYCEDCGYEQVDIDVCPNCGGENLTKIDRMNGYLSFSRVHGDTRLNSAKMEEIKERKSM
jgi:ribonucleoside-triphosphate reductase